MNTTLTTSDLPFESWSVQDATQAIREKGHHLQLTDECGFFLCQGGWVDVSLNDQTFHLQKGDIYFYLPSTFVGLLGYSEDLEGIAVKCRIDFLLPMIEQVFDGDSLLAMRTHPCILLTPVQQESLETLVRFVREREALLSSLGKASGASHILQRLISSLVESLFHELLFDYASSQSVQPLAHDKQDNIFQMFLVSLFKNYKHEREVSFYAAEQCLTPRYFSSVIKEKSGHSALQWIIQMVISSARQMLTETDLSIKEIAMEFNFPSQSFFGKYFKQYVGISPKEYRLQERRSANPAS